jgi:hypothetical protein
LSICQPLRDIPWQAEKSITISSVDGAVSAGRTRAFNDPILDGITEFLCALFEGVADVAQLGQLLHCHKSHLAAVDAKNTLQADDPPSP